MPLAPGTTLGPHAVTAKIGEVYRARDTKLDRDVALNVLPQAFTDGATLSPQRRGGAAAHIAGSIVVMAAGTFWLVQRVVWAKKSWWTSVAPRGCSRGQRDAIQVVLTSQVKLVTRGGW